VANQESNIIGRSNFLAFFRNIMQDLSHYSLSQLRTLEVQIVEELKKRHFLGVSQAREQILHIARGAGLSVEELLAGKGPKEPKSGSREAKFRHPDDASKQWSGRGRQPSWLKDWLAAGKSLDDTKV
jgi:DNA-binding protein H-NS